MADIQTWYRSEIGLLKITGNKDGITGISFSDDENTPDFPDRGQGLEECLTQLDEYFHGKRKKFTLPLSFSGTDFQERVWAELMNIPYGETASYEDIAMAVGNVKAVRAVGNANGKNPLPILVPCHRVILKSGGIGGYGSGVWRKKRLLELESALPHF